MSELSSKVLKASTEGCSEFNTAFYSTALATAAHQLVTGVAANAVSKAATSAFDLSDDKKNFTRKVCLAVANLVGVLSAVKLALHSAENNNIAGCIGSLTVATLFAHSASKHASPLEIADRTVAKFMGTKPSPAK